MNLSKKIQAGFLFAALFFVSSSLFADGWSNDYKAAVAEAEKERSVRIDLGAQGELGAAPHAALFGPRKK